MNTECINGIDCNRIETGAGRKVQTRKKRYGAIPLAWLKNLAGDSGKAKVITILWFLNAVKGDGWFSIDGNMRKEYGISPSQKIKILTSLEKSGHVQLRRSPGKAIQIRLIKPKGWK
jgi:hypothetical protein